MCLTIPKQVISVNKNMVKLKTLRNLVSKKKLSFLKANTETATTIIPIKKGDWVLTQNGVIIKKIKEKGAKEILKIIRTCAAAPRRTLFRTSCEIKQHKQ